MTHVELYRLGDGMNEELVGTISWDGQRLVPNPDTPQLREVLQEAVPVRVQGRNVAVRARDNPELWLENLHRLYHGSRFWASQVQGDASRPDASQAYPSQGA